MQAEQALLEALHRGQPPESLLEDQIQPIITLEQVLSWRKWLTSVNVEPGVSDYVLKIVRATREHELLLMGAGPRGSMYLLQAAKGRAICQGRDFVSPDDVVAMVGPVLGHRVVLTAEAEVSSERASDVLTNILNKIEVPR